MDLQAHKRFHNLTVEQVQSLDQVLTEVLPICGRGNFPTLEVRAKDMIRGVRERLAERSIVVRDVRLNGDAASHVMLQDNGLGHRDLDIVFGVDVPRQEDFQVIKEVVFGVLRDLLPCGVNRRKITWLTMKEAYVQKMVKVFNEHDRWSLIALSDARSKTVGLRFVGSLRRQFEFSVDSFQIILDRMLERYREVDSKQEVRTQLKQERSVNLDQGNSLQKDAEKSPMVPGLPDLEGRALIPARGAGDQWKNEGTAVSNKDVLEPLGMSLVGLPDVQPTAEPEGAGAHVTQREEEVIDVIEGPLGEEDLCGEMLEEKPSQTEFPLVPSSTASLIGAPDPAAKAAPRTPQMTEESSLKLESLTQTSGRCTQKPQTSDLDAIQVQCHEGTRSKAGRSIHRTNNKSKAKDPGVECAFPPPAKKTCSDSQDAVLEFCPSPVLQRKMSRKTLTRSPPPPPPPPQEKWSLLTEMTTQLFPPIELPKTPESRVVSAEDHNQDHNPHDSGHLAECFNVGQAVSLPEGTGVPQRRVEHRNNGPGPSTEPLDSKAPQGVPNAAPSARPVDPSGSEPQPSSGAECSWVGCGGEPLLTVEAECMFGDFQLAMDHLRCRLIATRSPEEIRGGGLLKYSDLLVRNFRAASEEEIRSLERYMCSRFFIDFPDVEVQQRKIEAYLRRHFAGAGEASRYDYLMTLRRVIDESTVCLMGHERRQTLNMITVLALRVLGEQNAIPNTANVTCFYQPAAYMAEPIFSSYYYPPPQPRLLYHPYPLHLQLPSGLV